jgi:hypothetical protein
MVRVQAGRTKTAPISDSHLLLIDLWSLVSYVRRPDGWTVVDLTGIALLY